ncbi:MAG: FecR domain-containing protein [Mucilaginibacter sp.]|uniref:FecR domain-containing protein n=1 Tax=Mucilaginibacter sp. TaxID=1882438 RepID=UPI0032672B42
MNEKMLNEFFKKFSENRHTEYEHEQFINWLKSASTDEANKVIEKYSTFFESLDANEQKDHLSLINTIETNLNILDTEGDNENRPHKLWINVKRITAIAAILFLIAAFGLYFWPSHTSKNISQNTVKANQIIPGGNKAVLTLANGSKIILDDAKNGILASEGNTNINKAKDGQLLYHQSKSNNDRDTLVANNMITTPRGGQYQVILPDGSKVWLNAASSLKFPTLFKGKERRVELTGEAYFEVAKNKAMPFRVSVNHMQVEVLGTHFNIMAYPDENYTNTTLLEGSVKVSRDKESKIIIPGERALVNNNSGIVKVGPANIDEAVAWQKGYYIFTSENIKSIMRKIARWYDVDVSYTDNFDDKDFSGKISRLKNITEVLNMLELTGDVHFKIEGRRVSVMP